MTKSMPIEADLRARARVWLEHNGRPVFGDGRARLLEAVQEAGSIKGGAEALGMSYRHAWGHIAHIEKRLGVKVVQRRTGGPRGGGTRLTEAGERLLKTYNAFRKTLDKDMQKIWLRFAWSGTSPRVIPCSSPKGS